VDEPLGYIPAISLVAVGFGKIYIIGSRNVKRFKILFYDYSGNFPEGIREFVNAYLGKYLIDYGIDVVPITINLVSDRALSLVNNVIHDDDNERKIILDFSTNPTVKIYVRKLSQLTGLNTYAASLAGDLKVYRFIRSKLGGREEKYHIRGGLPGFPEIYSRALKSQSSIGEGEQLYLLASGLISGEITLDIQDENFEIHTPTYEIGYPFPGLPRMVRNIGQIRKVAIVGCGALGTFYAIQLALLINMRMLRIKEIVFIDPDDIELVNFNRQVLYWGDTIKEPKASVMAERFEKMIYDPIITRSYEATFSEVKQEIVDSDLIIEGVDTWEARKQIARFAIENKIPLITAGVELLVGHETAYWPNKTYCPFHSISLEEKVDPVNRTGCLMIDPSVIFTNITMASLAILNSIGLSEPLNGVTYYSLKGEYEIYQRFKLETYREPCGD